MGSTLESHAGGVWWGYLSQRGVSEGGFSQQDDVYLRIINIQQASNEFFLNILQIKMN